MTLNQNIPPPLTRESLYNIVWSEPMLKVAARLGISSSYMARICTYLNIPKPERGYWAKLAAGKAKSKPPLPEPPPGVSSEIFVGGHEIKLPKTISQAPLNSKKRKEKIKYIRPTNHVLIKDAIKHFKHGRFKHELGYLKPDKHKLLDLTVTKNTFERALEFAYELFLAFEERGCKVVLSDVGYKAPVEIREEPSKVTPYSFENLWRPNRCTVVYISTTAIGLTILKPQRR